ncbi:MAG: FAD-dependent monooxygenase [Ramlibacter sp.]
MTPQALIAGGGIGGLAAALACARAGCDVRLYEQAGAFSEVGAGVQLGPNAVRRLQAWGLTQALARVAAQPARLRVCNAISGQPLATLALNPDMAQRYGAPYCTVHRADLHAVLLEALVREGSARLKTACPVRAVRQDSGSVTLSLMSGLDVEGDLLVGADGLWSTVRQQLLADGAAIPTGHVAYRALASQQALPVALRSQQVTVWLGPRLHVVAYPVRRGELLNLVAIVQGPPRGEAQDWDQAAVVAELQAAMGQTCAAVRDLVQAMPQWRLWTLNARAPVASPQALVRGRVALLGDAAHPMLPYLAQGAGMAIEDAAELGSLLTMTSAAALDVPLALSRYALNRWQRVARVQARSLRNGRIFHATGVMQAGRDLSLRLLGPRVLDVPWLYAG